MTELEAGQGAPECLATIAICTYNRITTLPRTLRSLQALRGDFTFEVLVVNGPSTDGTTEYLETCPGVRVLQNPEVNLSVSRNIAIANAAGRYISFIDDDAIPEADWLELVVARLEADPGLSALGGFIRDADGINYQARYVTCDALGRTYFGDDPDYVALLSGDVHTFPSLTGTNVTFRLEDLRRIGGFDEVYAYFYDETDVNKRMDDAGLRAEVLPQAEIHHKYAPSHLRTEKKVATNMYPIAKSTAYFAIRHGGPALGWTAAVERLQSFYANEFKWKVETLAAGNLNHTGFRALMNQTRRGIIDGIDAAMEALEAGTGTGTGTGDGADPQARLARHAVPAPAVLRRANGPDRDLLRLCMFSQDHGFAQQGGIGRWSNLVARGLAERGHEVTVLGHLGRQRPQEFCDFTEHGYWSHNLGRFEREAGQERDCLGLPAIAANASKRMLSEIERIQPRRRFQVASSPIWDVEGAALIAAGTLPTVLSLHTCTGLILPSKPEWRENEEFYRNHVLRVMNAEIQALKRCPMILANSTAILRDISGVYGMDLFDRPHAVVPHGLADIEAPGGLLEARQAARAEGAPLRVLFLGRLETRKGIAHLVPALHRLLETHEDVVVDLIGAKVDEENFRLVRDLCAAWPERVVWHGFLADEETDALMRQADIFVAPSLYESFGLIYIEAARYAIPSVGFAVGGVPEVVEDGADGLLVPEGDERALCAALSRLVGDDDLRDRMSRAARAGFEAKFGYQLMAERLERVYRDTIGGEPEA
ncbi:glycosyltransferase [Antarcticimicrobium luteum]|uniref:Glycosyltransferase n=1 Tax=Antarcticimicrobium luteum TaxID=2547397 RepID=A0A4R5VF04_9RHOB|nr:glycosyltransferase [Antarcticimicrobium luteum]TDK50906.1 glycosyltransferase [Antarcticimicrobium luteum]